MDGAVGMRDCSHHVPFVISGQVTPWLWGYLVHQLNNHAQTVVNFEGFAAALSPRLLWLLISVFPRDLVNVLFPTTHASGIGSELF